jgi:hypothetical protein
MDVNTIISQLTTERDKLDQAIVALRALGDQPQAAPAPTPRRRSRARAAPQKTVIPAEPPKVIPVGKLLKLIADEDGQTTSGLAKLTGGDQSKILELLQEQEAAGEVTRSGQRRTTTWRRVTDEDRVVARAAELEAAQTAALDDAPKTAATQKRREARRKAAERRKRLAERAAVER